MTTYRTNWGMETIEIRANFAEASCPVQGADGFQVADFCHRPADAMRHVIETEARAEGLDLDDKDTQAEIAAAVANMEEIEESTEEEQVDV
jgi:peptidyl-tRNA hydrolase